MKRMSRSVFRVLLRGYSPEDRAWMASAVAVKERQECNHYLMALPDGSFYEIHNGQIQQGGSPGSWPSGGKLNAEEWVRIANHNVLNGSRLPKVVCLDA